MPDLLAVAIVLDGIFTLVLIIAIVRLNYVSFIISHNSENKKLVWTFGAFISRKVIGPFGITLSM